MCSFTDDIIEFSYQNILDNMELLSEYLYQTHL
jgi:hypothetical protein